MDGPVRRVGSRWIEGRQLSSTTLCVAVGTDANTQEIYSVGAFASNTWNWSTSTIIPPDASTEGELGSCASATTCVATGVDSGGTSIVVTGAVSSGAVTWSATTPMGVGSVGSDEFFNIRCPSTTECVAAGIGTANNEEAAVATGTFANSAWTWTAATEITPDSSNKTNVTDVSCASTTACVVVGWDANGQPAYASGSYANSSWTWSAVAPISIGALANANLYGVSCGSATICRRRRQPQRHGKPRVGSLDVELSRPDGVRWFGHVGRHRCVVRERLHVSRHRQCGSSRGIYAPSQVLPGAPTIGAATSAYTAANISWTAGSTGSGTITGYTLNAFNETTSQTTTNACPASTTSTATSCTVTGLTEGDRYTSRWPRSMPSVKDPSRVHPRP